MASGTMTLETFLAVSNKIQYIPTYTLTSNSAPRYLPKRDKTYIHIMSCERIFIASLFIITPNWKQPKCPSAVE